MPAFGRPPVTGQRGQSSTLQQRKLAAELRKSHPKGTLVQTPRGVGKVVEVTDVGSIRVRVGLGRPQSFSSQAVTKVNSK